MGITIRSARHRQAMLGFYGLVGLAAVTLGVLGTGIYQDWRTLGNGLTSSWFCLAFFRSHRWHLAVLVVLVTVLLTALWRGGGSLWRQYRASRRLAGQAAALQVPIPEDLREVLRRRGLLGRVTLTGDDAAYAFAHGFLRPELVISRGLLDGLERDELEAVIAHEKYHLLRRDPLKMLIGRAITHALFFLPLAGHLLAGFSRAKELAADELAVQEMGDSVPLSSALYKMLRQGREATADVPLAGVLGAADLRIAQLLSAPAHVHFPLVPGRQVAMTLIALMALLASFTTGCA